MNRRRRSIRRLTLGETHLQHHGRLRNAAARLETFVTSSSPYAYGGYPDIDGLFREQAFELDRRRREAILHRIQQPGRRFLRLRGREAEGEVRTACPGSGCGDGRAMRFAAWSEIAPDRSRKECRVQGG